MNVLVNFINTKIFWSSAPGQGKNHAQKSGVQEPVTAVAAREVRKPTWKRLYIGAFARNRARGSRHPKENASDGGLGAPFPDRSWAFARAS